jgi:aspartyl-tRNA(Asn)/glutamyl-tRNA(Gln) amidotransferase subunit A
MNTQQKLKKYLSEIEKNDKKINAFLQLNPLAMEEAKKIDNKMKLGKFGKLAGQIIAVKSNINVKGLNISCASKVLENYKGTYDADVIKRIKAEDGLIIGMTNMDEFASGSSGETSAFGPTRNPQNLDLIPGGSSSGSVASVSAGMCDIALGSDTAGSIRNPSSHCGVVGVKPTYSSVSRNGLIDLSMSLDQIGPIAKNVSDAALLLDIIKGKTKDDSISQESKKINLKEIEKIPKNLKVGILDFNIGDERIRELVKNNVETASKKYGWNAELVKLNYLDLVVETYYPLVYVEFFSGTRRFDGRKYGFRIEEKAGPEVLRRILGGAEISKAEHHGRYYYKALKIKKLIEKEFEKVFSKFDCVISPTVPELPHKIGEEISVEKMYGYDVLTVPPNLAGNCAISIPAGKIDNISVGMQIICDKFQEEKMLQIARSFEKLSD